MGIFTANQLGTEAGEHFHHPTDKCFYCAEPLDCDRWIYWSGTETQIWMHPACAKRLADALNRDWREYQQRYPESK